MFETTPRIPARWRGAGVRRGLREADLPRLLDVQGLAPGAHDVPVLAHEVALEAVQVVRADLNAERIRESGGRDALARRTLCNTPRCPSVLS